MHARDKRVAPDADFNKIARATGGYTGAQLMAVMNTAAITAVRRGSTLITTDDMLTVRAAAVQSRMSPPSPPGTQSGTTQPAVLYRRWRTCSRRALKPVKTFRRRRKLHPTSGGALLSTRPPGPFWPSSHLTLTRLQRQVHTACIVLQLVTSENVGRGKPRITTEPCRHL